MSFYRVRCAVCQWTTLEGVGEPLLWFRLMADGERVCCLSCIIHVSDEELGVRALMVKRERLADLALWKEECVSRQGWEGESPFDGSSNRWELAAQNNSAVARFMRRL